MLSVIFTYVVTLTGTGFLIRIRVIRISCMASLLVLSQDLNLHLQTPSSRLFLSHLWDSDNPELLSLEELKFIILDVDLDRISQCSYEYFHPLLPQKLQRASEFYYFLGLCCPLSHYAASSGARESWELKLTV